MPRGINQFDEDRLDGLNVGDANSSNIVSPGIVTDGLVLHLDAGNYESYPIAGTTWYDLSGYRNNGTLTNGPTYIRDGGGAISFDGTNDYVDCGSNASVNITGTGLTLGVWVYRTASNGNYQYRRIIEKAAAYPALQYSLVTSALLSGIGEGRLIFDLYLNGSLPTGLAGTTQLALNTWYYVTATYDGANRRLFVNSVLDGTLATTGNITSTTSNLSIGQYLANTSLGDIFQGRIPISQVYNRALTPTEVAQNFNALRARFNI